MCKALKINHHCNVAIYQVKLLNPCILNSTANQKKCHEIQTDTFPRKLALRSTNYYEIELAQFTKVNK